MSLHTIVSSGVVGRLHSRRGAATAVIQPHASPITALLSGSSMRVLETGIAIVAIATALLIGLGR